jgi:hypothetical protein
MYSSPTTNVERAQNTTVNKSPNMCEISTEPIKGVLFATREGIEQLNATGIQTENFKRKGNEKDDDATMAVMSAQIETRVDT